VPEYGLVVAAVAGAIVTAKPVVTCPGVGLTPITEALEGPEGVAKLGREMVAEALGRPGKPWPRNTRAFSYQGRRYVPDFVKAGSLYEVDTGERLGLTPAIRDEQAIARKHGGDLVVVTRRKTALAAPLSKAVNRAWRGRTGRLRIVRCI
jgi:hypothetical protein